MSQSSESLPEQFSMLSSMDNSMDGSTVSSMDDSTVSSVDPNTEMTRSVLDSPRFNWVLWLILILLIGVGIGIFLWLGLSLFQTPSTPPPQLSCAGNITQVPDVSDMTQFTPCYELNGQTPNNQRFYDTVNDWTVALIPASDIPAANLICLEFCSEVVLPSTCNGQTSTYTSCLSKLTPQNCTDPSLPAATQGSTPLYAIGRGQISCYPNMPCPS